MERKLKNITIAITNLGTGRFEYYDVKDKADYINSISAFNEEFNKYDNDIEIQLIDCDYKGGLDDSNVENFLNLMEEYEDIQPQELIYLLSEYEVNDVRYLLNRGSFFAIIEADNRVEAFREYIKEYDALEIPDHLESYIDYESILNDWECENFNVARVLYRTYLIVNE